MTDRVCRVVDEDVLQIWDSQGQKLTELVQYAPQGQ